MRRIVGMAVLVVGLVWAAPAGAAPGPRVSARLSCTRQGVVRVVTTYKLPAAAHAQWLDESLSYQGLKLVLGKRVRMVPNSVYYSNNVLGQDRLRDATVKWVARNTKLVWHLPPIKCG